MKNSRRSGGTRFEEVLFLKVNVKARPARDHPAAGSQRNAALTQQSLVWLTDQAGFDSLACSGYTRLSDSPEVSTAVDTIARLVGAMTIHHMKNGDSGDIRVKDNLSELVDITPNRLMTRSNFVQWIVRTMLLDGRGNAVVWPRTEGGRLRELLPVPPAFAAFVPNGLWDYRVTINGAEFDPDTLLHFVCNPGSFYPWLGTGFQITLADVANNLKQAAATEKGFMSSKWKPSLIVKVDGMFDAMGNPIGREQLLKDYVQTNEAGQPWVIPAEQFQVQEVKPLTLSDLALADFVKLDKQTVATILGVPPFVLGVGSFKRDEWNSFVSTTIMPIAQNIQQELTRKLIIDGESYFRFSSRSLYNYDLRDLATVADDQYVRGIMTGNEVRDWIGLSPLEGLDDLIILENYIPRGMIADQAKLQGGENT